MRTQTAGQRGISHLYNYQPYKSEWLKKPLFEHKVHFSNAKNFNDPWDCRPWFNEKILDDAATYERHVRWFERTHQRHLPLLEEQRRRAVDRARSDRAFLVGLVKKFSSEFPDALHQQYRMYCLATTLDCALMWSHYADKHKGVCLEFNCDNYVFSEALKVEYCDEYPLLDLTDDSGETILLPLTTRSKDWSYEDEYRVIVQEQKAALTRGMPMTQDEFLVLPEGSLRAVITGCLMPQEQREEVRQVVEQAGSRIELKEAVLVPNQYRLTIESCSKPRSTVTVS